MRRPWLIWICAISVLLAAASMAADPAEDLTADDPGTRRMAALELASSDAAAIPLLKDALDDSDPLVRRTAARALSSFGRKAIPALATALKSDDGVLKGNVCMFLADMGPEAAASIRPALDDEDEMVRARAVTALTTVEPMNQQILDIIMAATDDESPLVSSTAVEALMSHMKVVFEKSLPTDGWKFRTDPEEVGREEQWYAVDLDESGWKDINIGDFWGEFGFDYEGVGWYRRTIALPEDPGGTKTVLHFEAVDESTWVWVNGEFAGVHDIGPQGWTKPFRIEMTGLVTWGGDNQITVRVLNTKAAGGIYRPVTLRSYDTGQSAD